jgi:hypothetical protein
LILTDEQSQQGKIPLAMEEGNKEQASHQKLHQGDNKNGRKSVFLGFHGNSSTRHA